MLGGAKMGRSRFLLIAVVVAGMVTIQSAAGQSGQCVIKGNVSTQGERIYHVPGQRYYDATRISPSHGERWFCTEEEARAAGWRKAKV